MPGDVILSKRRDVLDQLARDLDCPVCYRARHLRKLPCNHAFCRSCIDKWSHKSNLPDPNGNSNHEVKLTCPMCRTLATIPTGGLPRYETEDRKAMKSLREFLSLPSSKPDNVGTCVMCPYEVTTQSLTLYQYCVDNHMVLCQPCQQRFYLIPTAPPLEEVKAPNRYHQPCPPPPPQVRYHTLDEVWSTVATSRGRYTDAVILKDGNIVVSDYYEEKFIRFDAKTGKPLASGKFKPCCMTYDPKRDVIAYTKNNSKCLHQLNPERLKEVYVQDKEQVKCESQLEGLSRFDDGRVVVTMDGSVAIYDDRGRCLHRWLCNSNLKPFYLAVGSEHVIASCRDANSVVVYDTSGREVRRLGQGKVRCPRGVSVDDKNRVFIVHEDSSRASQLTVWCLATGQQLAEVALPKVPSHSRQVQLVKVLTTDDKLVLVYSHFVMMTYML